MIAYLAHPIDLIDDAELESQCDQIQFALRKCGFTVYLPGMAFVVGDEAKPDGRISEVNETALRLADVVVVVAPEERTIGTVLEMATAVQSGKPTVIVSRAIDTSWSLAGFEKYNNAFLTDLWGPNHAEWLRDMANAGVWSNSTFAPLKYESLTPDAQACDFAPQRQYPGDAGYDLYVSEDTEIPIGRFVDIPCGIAIELPPDTWGFVIGRSSTLRKHNLMVAPGVIDNGYRGPLYAGVYNMNGTQFSAKKGMRLAQLIPFPLTAAGMIPVGVPALTSSDRGQAGFGSTGE